jgi:hypothetical protein
MRRSGGGDSGIRHKGKGMDDGSFNSMSPLLRNSGPHGSWQAGSCCSAAVLHASIIKKVIRGPLRKTGAFRFKKSKCCEPLAALWPPCSHPACFCWLRSCCWTDLLGASSRRRRWVVSLAPLFQTSISLHQRTTPCTTYKGLQGPITTHNGPQVPTSAHKCVQVPAEADVSARAGIAAASHPILQHYSLR